MAQPPHRGFTMIMTKMALEVYKGPFALTKPFVCISGFFFPFEQLADANTLGEVLKQMGLLVSKSLFFSQN